MDVRELARRDVLYNGHSYMLSSSSVSSLPFPSGVVDRFC